MEQGSKCHQSKLSHPIPGYYNTALYVGVTCTVIISALPTNAGKNQVTFILIHLRLKDANKPSQPLDILTRAAHLRTSSLLLIKNASSSSPSDCFTSSHQECLETSTLRMMRPLIYQASFDKGLALWYLVMTIECCTLGAAPSFFTSLVH